ncbi:rRNA N6-adenosine-methyltransferase ZCCHC4-like isoform X1 [Gordionus sp. m RMFG-2023]|uniref:rRNA N6-adenosine-methyltransferase ZCCHC4-like isoform X1 n=1 Tax=Gordionus sp. m RMFG-2023 TaxID=3053472 RepID=UPI0031FC7D4B
MGNYQSFYLYSHPEGVSYPTLFAQKMKQSNVVEATFDQNDELYCSHGPTLKFLRKSDGEEKYFYSCSAYRSRKECAFFKWSTDKISNQYKGRWLDDYRTFKKLGIPHNKRFKLYQNMLKNGSKAYKICNTCNIIIGHDQNIHIKHVTKPTCTINETKINDNKSISTLIPIQQDKKEAQYHFSQETIKFIEHIINKIDIDPRLTYFWNANHFAHYNFCNNHFFNPKGRVYYENFLMNNCNIKNDDPLLIIMDPPFGVLIEVLANSLDFIIKNAKKVILTNNYTSMGNDMHILLANPYYMKNYISKYMKNLEMLEFKVTYDNHKKNGMNDILKSPIRLFTSIPLSEISLTPDLLLNYKICDKCNKMVCRATWHCQICRTCPINISSTKQYKHCHAPSCDTCVKPSFVHCAACDKCHPPVSTCCPLKNIDSQKNKKPRLYRIN